MKYTYWLHEKIQKDFNESFAWYESKKAGLGYEFMDLVENKILQIVDNPERYGSKGNSRFREAHLRRFPFVIVFRIYKKKNEIFISAIHHTKKSPRKKYRK